MSQSKGHVAITSALYSPMRSRWLMCNLFNVRRLNFVPTIEFRSAHIDESREESFSIGYLLSKNQIRQLFKAAAWKLGDLSFFASINEARVNTVIFNLLLPVPLCFEKLGRRPKTQFSTSLTFLKQNNEMSCSDHLKMKRLPVGISGGWKRSARSGGFEWTGIWTTG